MAPFFGSGFLNGQNEKSELAPAFTLGLTADAMWPTSSSSCRHAFSTMVECAFKTWAQMNPPSLMLFWSRKEIQKPKHQAGKKSENWRKRSFRLEKYYPGADRKAIKLHSSGSWAGEILGQSRDQQTDDISASVESHLQNWAPSVPSRQVSVSPPLGLAHGWLRFSLMQQDLPSHF